MFKKKNKDSSNSSNNDSSSSSEDDDIKETFKKPAPGKNNAKGSNALFKKHKLGDYDEDSDEEATEEQANLKGSINEPVKDVKTVSDKNKKKIVV